MTAVPQERWKHARAAVLDTGRRFDSLVRSTPDPAAMATAEWSIADSAAHVLSIATLCLLLLDPDAPPPPVPGLRELLSATNVDTVADTNSYVMRHLPERDIEVVRHDLQTSIERILLVTRTANPASTVTWLGDAQVTVAGVLAHLVNEMLVHGWDMARAARLPWPMPDADAALFFDLFLVDMIRNDYGALLNADVRMPKHRIAVRFRSAHTTTAILELHQGRVEVAPPGGPYDASLTFRPARFNLMLFGRISALRAAASRDVVVGGPRPWRLRAFLRVVHMPNNARP
ncbi:maleylpyruvate isomerase N-terminal domain-containing protein [Dactylosporangium sp. NPDC049525]|uniref:maleylpyruvate isomerase N-terminal domain-containing protein n=1 Tax=Dactylosporangium sp. NPDC049525 TaxID=3154730 RepID=UPI00343273D6